MVSNDRITPFRLLTEWEPRRSCWVFCTLCWSRCWVYEYDWGETLSTSWLCWLSGMSYFIILSLSLLLCMIYCLILFFYLLGSQNYISLAGGVAVTENIILSWYFSRFCVFNYIGRSCAIFQLISLFGLELCYLLHYLHTSRQLQNTLSFYLLD